MAILRTSLGNYGKVKKVKGTTERKSDDFDLAWGNHRVYVLAEHEWFDPHTSTKYDDGVSRHAYFGPSLIVQDRTGGGLRTADHYVNDPEIWAWIRRCIAEGHLSADSISPGINDERDVTFS